MEAGSGTEKRTSVHRPAKLKRLVLTGPLKMTFTKNSSPSLSWSPAGASNSTTVPSRVTVGINDTPVVSSHKRVELKPLTREDLRRILTEPAASLIRQYKALLATEGVTLDFAPEAIDEIAGLAETINANVENIGARRLHTVMERLLEEISFTASDQKNGAAVTIDRDYVKERVGVLAKNADLSKFIL